MELNTIKAKATKFINLITESDNQVTKLPVGMGCFTGDERPIFFHGGSAVTYTSEFHTYWGTLVGCSAKCVYELSGVISRTVNNLGADLNFRKLIEDPYIDCLLTKASGFSSQYGAIESQFDIEFGTYEKDESKTDFFHYPCIIKQFDFKDHENNDTLTLGNGLMVMRIIDSFELFTALLGEDGKAYPFLEEVKKQTLGNFQLKMIDEKLDELLEKQAVFLDELKAYREENH